MGNAALSCVWTPDKAAVRMTSARQTPAGFPQAADSLRSAPRIGQSRVMTPELEALMTAQAGVFSAAQAAQLGVTRDDLHVGRHSKRLHVVRRGIYTSAQRLDEADGV